MLFGPHHILQLLKNSVYYLHKVSGGSPVDKSDVRDPLNYMSCVKEGKQMSRRVCNTLGEERRCGAESGSLPVLQHKEHRLYVLTQVAESYGRGRNINASPKSQYCSFSENLFGLRHLIK